ncbi:hypothetical protein BGZ76_001251 [Entomortierella beljakovae]|nr:hypothetical protein BGZ76_001251 [Entomortierella beljakovae]
MQSSRPSKPSTTLSPGMVSQPKLVQQVGHDVGPPSHRLVRDLQEYQASDIHELETRTTSHSPECSLTILGKPGPSIHMFSMGSNSTNINSTSTTTIISDSNNSKLVWRHLVSCSPTDGKANSSSLTSIHRSPRIAKRQRDSDEEPSLVLARMDHMRRNVMSHRRLDESAISLPQDATSQILKKKNYAGARERYLQRYKQNNVYFFTPNVPTRSNFTSIVLGQSLESQESALRYLIG